MKKFLNPLLVIVIIGCVLFVFHKLKDNGYIKPNTSITCHTLPMTTVYSDNKSLKAVHKVKRCDDSGYLKNRVVIENKVAKSEVIVYESRASIAEAIYLVWESHDGLIIAKPDNGELVSSKKHYTEYDVSYLSLQKLRVAIGNALKD